MRRKERSAPAPTAIPATVPADKLEEDSKLGTCGDTGCDVMGWNVSLLIVTVGLREKPDENRTDYKCS
jgi:hypothetical protein